MAVVGCPHCGHVFAPEEVTEGWCGACGKQIPEFALRKARAKRGPGAARKALAKQQREFERSNVWNVRVTGLLCFAGGIALLVGAAALGVFVLARGAQPGYLIGALGVGGLLLAAAGARMFVRGRVENDGG